MVTSINFIRPLLTLAILQKSLDTVSLLTNRGDVGIPPPFSLDQ